MNFLLLIRVLMCLGRMIETVMLFNVLDLLNFRFGLSYTIPGGIFITCIAAIHVFLCLLLPYLIGDEGKGIFFMSITALVSIEMRLNAFPSDCLLLFRVIALSVVPKVDVKILVAATSIGGFVVAGHFEGRGGWDNSVEVVGVRLMLSWLELHGLRFEYILIIKLPKLSNNSSTSHAY